jgi:hypothetical protein
VSDVVLRTSLVGLVLAALGGCTMSSGGSGLPLGFGTAYDSSADGGAPRILRSVRGSGAGNGWAVGEMGLSLALSGARWSEVPSGSIATLGGLSAADASHAYAVELGGDRVLAWNGRTWTPLGEDRPGRAAAATWATSSKDVWVAGDGIEHWDGTQWTQAVPPGTTFTSIAGSFPTDVWAVGPGGVQHFDGDAWSAVSVPAGTPALAAVWATNVFDAWIVGAQGTVLHWNGSAWTRMTSGTTVDLTSVTGPDVANIWIGGKDGTLLFWNGASFGQTATPSAKSINDVWLPPGGDLMLVDDTGTVVSYVR